MPRFERRWTGVWLTLRPSKCTRPWVGFWSPLITLKQVVLPAPLGPIRPVMVPASAVKDAWSTAVTPPNCTTRSSTSRSDMSGHLPGLVGVVSIVSLVDQLVVVGGPAALC